MSLAKHTPTLQVSLTVHALPSSQVPELPLITQPIALLQTSSVHRLPSSQLITLPAWQVPPTQLSTPVHKSPSVQVASMGTKTQPLAPSQLSPVHTFWSSQLVTSPGKHAPPLQKSLIVHALPSLQGPLLLTWLHPLMVSTQSSTVHGFPSLQSAISRPMHTPFSHASPTVHALPSLQVTLMARWTHPKPLSQLSLVQAFLSSQPVLSPPEQAPPLHTSPLVQALPSSQKSVVNVWTQPSTPSQASLLHKFPSSQEITLPLKHVPLAQLSPRVHALPSSHGALLAPLTQPLRMLQPSSVQGLPSLHTRADPELQSPDAQISLIVHAFPSSQAIELKPCVQPTLLSQASSVQRLPSSQLGALPPTQNPPEQTSIAVQASPSEHPAEFTVKTQPTAKSQLSSVHTEPSAQTTFVPGMQAPPPQMSPKVQAFPSLHTAVVAT